METLGREKSVAARLHKARKGLEKKRETVAMWEGALLLLRDLPGLPDGEPVSGKATSGFLEDVNGQLPHAENKYFDVGDKGFLTGLGIPADEVHDAWNWEGWTAGMVRRAVDRMARQFKTDPAKILAKALRSREEIQAEGERAVRELNRNQVGTRSFSSNSGSNSNLGHSRSTRAIGARLMRAINA